MYKKEIIKACKDAVRKGEVKVKLSYYGLHSYRVLINKYWNREQPVKVVTKYDKANELLTITALA